MKNFFLIFFYFIGLCVFFVDFISFRVGAMIEPQYSPLYLIVATVLMVVLFGVTGCLDVSRRTRDFMGWFTLGLLAALWAYLGYQRLGLEEAAVVNRGKAQIGIGIVYALICVGLALLALKKKDSAAHAGHGH